MVASTKIRDVLIACRSAGLCSDRIPIKIGPFTFSLSFNTGCQYWEWEVVLTAPDGDKLTIAHDEDDYRSHPDWAFGVRSGPWDGALEGACSVLSGNAAKVETDRASAVYLANQSKLRAEAERIAKFAAMFPEGGQR